MPGRKETRFEEQVCRDSEQQLANNIGGSEEGRQHKDCHHHVGALAADGFVIHDARTDKRVGHQRELEHTSERKGKPERECYQVRDSEYGLQYRACKAHAELHNQREADDKAEGDACDKEPAGHGHDGADESLFVVVQGGEHELPHVPGDVGRKQHTVQQSRNLELQQEHFHRGKVVERDAALQGNLLTEPVQNVGRNKEQGHDADGKGDNRTQKRPTERFQMRNQRSLLILFGGH